MIFVRIPSSPHTPFTGKLTLDADIVGPCGRVASGDADDRPTEERALGSLTPIAGTTTPSLVVR